MILTMNFFEANMKLGEAETLDIETAELLIRVENSGDVLYNELAARLKEWQAPEPPLSSGYWRLYVDHVLQADQGADFDFLVGQRGAFVPKDNH